MLRLLLTVLVPMLPLAAGQTFWVARIYTGGPLCETRGPVKNFVPPGFESESETLKIRNVRIYRSYFSDHPTCQACRVCPTYRREIFFEIGIQDSEAAGLAGFKAAERTPGEEELMRFEKQKKYQGIPDLPPEAD